MDRKTFGVVHILIEACKAAELEIKQVLDEAYLDMGEDISCGRPKFRIEKTLRTAIKQAVAYLETKKDFDFQPWDED